MALFNDLTLRNMVYLVPWCREDFGHFEEDALNCTTCIVYDGV